MNRGKGRPRWFLARRAGRRAFRPASRAFSAQRALFSCPERKRRAKLVYSGQREALSCLARRGRKEGGGRGRLGRALAGRAGADLFVGGGLGPVEGAERVLAAPPSHLPPRGPRASRPTVGALKGGLGELSGAFGALFFPQRNSAREGVRAVRTPCARAPGVKYGPRAAGLFSFVHIFSPYPHIRHWFFHFWTPSQDPSCNNRQYCL